MPSSKTALDERSDGTFDEITHLVEHCARRFSFETPDIAKRYLEGRLTVALHLRAWRGRQKFWIFMHCFDGEKLGGPALGVKVPSVTVAEDEHLTVPCLEGAHVHALNVANGPEAGMLVVHAEIMERPKQLVPSAVWLKLVDDVDGVTGQVFCLLPGTLFKRMDVLSEWEGCVLSGAGMLEGDFSEDIIKGCAQHMQDEACADSQIAGVLVPKAEAPNLLTTVKVQIADDVVAVSVDEALDFPVEVIDVAFGPIDLGFGYSEDVSRHVRKRL